MKDFLKGKPKEQFDKAPEMPEDMKELFRQRQREMAEERAEMAARRAEAEGDDNTLPQTITNPNMDQLTLPPPPKDEGPPPVRPATEASPRHLETTVPRPDGGSAAPTITRPREVGEPQKKKGKKGNDEP
jgi:hypothetical protein